jgi:hypothetical protein
VRQLARDVTELHQTINRMARMLEVHTAREEGSCHGMKEWLEDRDTEWDERHKDIVLGVRGIASVSNGSGPSLRVRVRVQTEPLPNWLSGSSINPNCPLGYGSMVNSQPV